MKHIFSVRFFLFRSSVKLIRSYMHALLPLRILIALPIPAHLAFFSNVEK
jgi:hypothetical protein